MVFVAASGETWIHTKAQVSHSIRLLSARRRHPDHAKLSATRWGSAPVPTWSNLESQFAIMESRAKDYTKYDF